MKQVFLLAAILLATPLVASPLDPQVDRAVSSAAHQANAQATLQLKFEKAVRMQDVMSRPSRGENVVLRWDHTTITCTGVITRENRIYFLAECLTPGDFEPQDMKELKVTLANGRKFSVNPQSMHQVQEVAWLPVPSDVSAGVAALPVLRTPQGQTLQEAFGKGMTAKLEHFYHANNIPARSHTCRIGYISRKKSSLKAGNPVIIDGKLTAFVKYVPSSYSGLFGGVSERSLALIY